MFDVYYTNEWCRGKYANFLYEFQGIVRHSLQGEPLSRVLLSPEAHLFRPFRIIQQPLYCPPQCFDISHRNKHPRYAVLDELPLGLYVVGHYGFGAGHGLHDGETESFAA